MTQFTTDADPFLLRIRATIESWIHNEWTEREAIRRDAAANGWSPQRLSEYHAAELTVETLAQRLDNISISKLRRELRKLDAPAPGDLIRAARIAHGVRLLSETRLLIREIALRAGYESEKHFSDQFQRATGMTPSAYRKQAIGKANFKASVPEPAKRRNV